MSNKMCDIFDLPPLPSNETSSVVVADGDYVEDNIAGIKEHVVEMNEIYNEAMQAYRDLMELAVGMEPTKTAGLAQTASNVLAIALAASKSKSDQRIKVVKSSSSKSKQNTQATGVPNSEGVVVASRADVLKALNLQK